MTTASHTSLARLSRIGQAFGIGPTHETRNSGSKGGDDSYIPYNGPYESPTSAQQVRGYWDDGVQDVAFSIRSRSHSPLNEEKVHNVYNQIHPTSNGHKYPDASRVTLSKIMTEPRRRFSRIRQNSTPPPRTSYVSLGQGGGVGDTPVPVHRTTSGRTGSPPKRRDSGFRASLTDPLKSFSRSDHKHEKTRLFEASTDDLAPSAVTSPSIHEQTPHRSRSNSAAVLQRHPYANASLSLGQPSPTRISPQGQNSEHLKFPPKKVPAHLRPSPRASRLKASMSTPNLRATSHQPAMYPKTKNHWLSAGTWCDAFMLPRPRFLLRHLGEEPDTPNPRLVSPAESIICEQITTAGEPKSSKRSQPVIESRTLDPLGAVMVRADRENAPQSPSLSRPRSYALDDLALPSPIPSLITVLADRQHLENERQMWQERATKSFGNKRTRSLSRSKSLGKTRKSSSQQPPAGAFDFLAERTLLGHQAIPSVVHKTSSSANPTQTGSGGGRATRSFGSTFPRLRSKSHGHSNSAGTILDGPGHRRKGSVTSILRRARSTATGLCVGGDGMLNPTDAPDSSVKEDDANVVTLPGRLQRTISPDSIVSISPAVDQNRASPNRGSTVPSHQRLNVSPTPSAQTQSAEGIGIAISLPPHPEEYPNDEPITLPAHPYAQGRNNHRRTPTNTPPQLSERTHYRQPIVHPYAIHSVHPVTLSPQWVHRDQAISPARKMFAEVTPGHLREIRPEEIQYSPYVEEAPRVFTVPTLNRPKAVRRESADPPLRRGSDTLRMGDALSFSLARSRLSSSTDSGIGASEDHHPYGRQPERTASSRSNAFPSRQVHEVLSAVNDERDEGTSEWLEPPPIFLRTDNGNSNSASLRTASSGQINPSVFSSTPAPAHPRVGSSGSSPGLSNDSSPPLTPRPLGRLDDLERFQDLFYNPTANPPQSPELLPATVPAIEPEDLRFVSSPVDLARRRSRLTTLVRQLSEDLYELRNERSIPEDDGQPDGPNDEPSSDPMTSVINASLSDGSPPALGATHAFLSTLASRHPLDQPVASLRQNFPEDVESEVSSLSDRIPVEDYDEITENLRLGNVEAVSTPPPTDSPRRVSGHVALIGDTTTPTARVKPSSNLIPPPADPTRSSFLTIDSSGSRISGLSAFPRPPSELVSYFVREAEDDMPELLSALQSPTSATAGSQGEWTHAL